MRTCVGLALMFLGTVIGCENSNRNEWTTYRSPDSAYTITFPSTWNSYFKDEMLTIEPPTKDAAITVSTHKYTLSLDDFAAGATEAAFASAKPVTEAKRIRVANLEAVHQEFEADRPHGRVRWIATFMTKDGLCVAVTVNGLQDAIAAHRDTYLEIVDSFRFSAN